jgi:hypothetical protein
MKGNYFMGKKSSYPAYSTGNIVVNGNTVATTSKDKSGVTGSYNMSDTEKDIYDSVQSGLSSSLANLFEISDEKQALWNDELDAYKRNGIQEIEDIYTPMETELKNDIASRFGNFDNSIFMDNLSTITDNKAKAVADLTDSLLMKQDELYNDEMTNRMNYVTLLSNLNSIMNNNILSYLTASQSNSTSGNNYNNQAYTASNQNALNWYNAGVNTLGTIGKLLTGTSGTSTSTGSSSTI